MNRAITFCAIALGMPVATYLIATGYTPTLSVLPGIHADNGLECTVDEDEKILPGLKDSVRRVWHIEFLHNSKFRVVDENAVNDILANDYTGTMTTADTTYTFGDPTD